MVWRTEDHTLYAHFKVNKYDISFDTNGHGQEQAKMTGLFVIPEKLPVLTETGYTFGGWYTAKECKDSQKAVAGSKLTANTTLFAKWTVNSYNVTLDPGIGKIAKNSIKVTYGQPYGELPTPSAEYGKFLGWFTAKDGGYQVNAHTVVSSDKDHTLYAHYDLTKYTVFFDNNGHGEAQSKVEGYFIPAKLPVLSERGYTFGGWYTSKAFEEKDKAVAGAKLSADVTLFAKWTANSYVVTFDANGGTFDKNAVTKKNVTFGQTYGELPTVTAVNKTFAGWFTDKTKGNEITAKDIVNTAENHTLYARFIDWEELLSPYVTDANGNRVTSGSELEKDTKLYLTSDNKDASIFFTTKDKEAGNIPEDNAHL